MDSRWSPATVILHQPPWPGPPGPGPRVTGSAHPNLSAAIEFARGVLTVALLALGAASAAAQVPLQTGPSNTEKPTQALKTPPRDLIRQGLRPLSEELPDTSGIEGLMPPDASQGFFDRVDQRPTTFRQGDFSRTEFHWLAAHLRHRPLYFEDAPLERYGQTRRPLVQPFASGARFFATFPLLPYVATIRPPRPTISTLGYYRPGSYAPKMLQRPPWQRDAAVMEAVSLLGAIFVFP